MRQPTTEPSRTFKVGDYVCILQKDFRIQKEVIGKPFRVGGETTINGAHKYLLYDGDKFVGNWGSYFLMLALEYRLTKGRISN